MSFLNYELRLAKKELINKDNVIESIVVDYNNSTNFNSDSESDCDDDENKSNGENVVNCAQQ